MMHLQMHAFTKQSEKLHKITCLLTQINRSAHLTHPMGHMIPHPAEQSLQLLY